MVVEEWESRTAAQRSRMMPVPQRDRATGRLRENMHVVKASDEFHAAGIPVQVN